MTPMQRVRTLQALLVAALLTVFPPEDTAAQAGHGGNGFLFEQPIVSVGLRTGYALQSAGSDIFVHTGDQLTVEKGDFSGGYVGGEIGVRLSDHVDLALGLGHASSSTASEFRDWTDNDDLPIEQITQFSTTPVTLSAKYYLMDRGRSIGRFAWVPSRMNVYVGGGVGMTFYRFDQSGDWVDFETLDIFASDFRSSGNGKQMHGLAGLDVSIHKSFYVTGETRYLWADAAIDTRFFDGFDDVDLAGFQFSVGISARF
jgi:hypothetical protein